MFVSQTSPRRSLEPGTRLVVGESPRRALRLGMPRRLEVADEREEDPSGRLPEVPRRVGGHETPLPWRDSRQRGARARRPPVARSERRAARSEHRSRPVPDDLRAPRIATNEAGASVSSRWSANDPACSRLYTVEEVEGRISHPLASACLVEGAPRRRGVERLDVPGQRDRDCRVARRTRSRTPLPSAPKTSKAAGEVGAPHVLLGLGGRCVDPEVTALDLVQVARKIRYDSHRQMLDGTREGTKRGVTRAEPCAGDDARRSPPLGSRHQVARIRDRSRQARSGRSPAASS
jgi:hypothetical protein